MIRTIILIHTIIEIIGGIALIFNPNVLMLSDDLTLQSAAIIKLFGVAVLGIGILSLVAYRRFAYTDWDRKIVVFFMGYHLVQSLQCYSMANQGIFSNMGAFIVHIVLAVLFMVFFMRERELFEERMPS